jgi:hypothetical protein
MSKQVSKLLGVLVAVLVFGQAVGQQMEDEVAAGRAMMRAGWDEMIREELPLTEKEAAGFWPIYEEYRDEMEKITDRYTAMVTDFVRRYDDGDFSDEYAEELLESFFGIKRELLDVRVKYIPRFKEALPALKVAQFYQLETKINAEIDAQLAYAIPLIDAS